ncbi:MAG: hypothetical protein AAGA18_09730 [Verrucomicrobiota bacterium]
MSKTINEYQVELRQGKLWIDGKHEFLKIGKPLRHYGDEEQIEKLIKDLPIIKAKHYRCLELNCYWHHLDPNGDGEIDVSTEPLKKLINAINEYGMFASLSVETYGVGGGQIPQGFWDRYPKSLAMDHEGNLVEDTEYGYMSKVPSLFNSEYLSASRAYIRNLTKALSDCDILWYETTVEPQYMGSRWIDYGPDARSAYENWLKTSEIDGPTFPDTFPVTERFMRDPIWNKFRAQNLAKWVNEDAQAYRDIVGEDAWIATDYLDAIEETMIQRCGDPLEFLRYLTGPNILQVNWTWHNFDRKPHMQAYNRVHQIMKETGRDWAVAEHMTINGTDYHAEDMNGLLENTLKNGTCLGWEFVDVCADLDSPDVKEGVVEPGNFKPAHFTVYDKDWNPIPTMAVVENNWDKWLERVKEVCSQPSA